MSSDAGVQRGRPYQVDAVLAPSAGSARRRDRGGGWRGVVVPLALVGLWALVAGLELVPARVLPTPAAVARSFADFFLAPRRAVLSGVVAYDGAALTHIAASLGRLASAFALAAAVGVPLGLGLGLSRRFADYVDPVVQGLRPIPIFAWLPLAFAWFGLGEGAARYLIFIGALFPIVIATGDGAARVPRALAGTALMLGTPRRQLWRRVYLPAALPSVVTGLRLGLTLGWMSVIVGELTGTRTGLGVMMFASREIGRLDRVIVGMACFALLGLATDLLVRRATGRLVAWSEH